MDFFQNQEALTTVGWALRAVIAFLFLVMVAKVLGQRAISQLRLLDFVIALVIGNIIAHPLSDPHLGLKGSIVTTSVLVILYLGGILMMLKWPGFRKWMEHKPIVLIRDGEILYTGLKKARISIDILLEELREEKIENVTKVALAIWEADGKLSVFLDPKYQPLTPSSSTGTGVFCLPKTIIKEGRINFKELARIHKDEQWLISQLKDYQTDVKNVLLAIYDEKNNLKVFLYN